MKEKVKNSVDGAIKHLNMYVSDVYLTTEDNIKNLNVELDSEEIIDLDKITEASGIINPIIDELDLIEGEYVLDIHSKQKGDEGNE